MRNANQTRKRVSLSNEIHLLLSAIEGIRFVLATAGDTDAPPHSVCDQTDALLTVVLERLRMLDQVARGRIDPRCLWCAANDDASSLEGDHIAFPVWTDARLLEHHHAEAERARRRQSRS